MGAFLSIVDQRILQKFGRMPRGRGGGSNRPHDDTGITVVFLGAAVETFA